MPSTQAATPDSPRQTRSITPGQTRSNYGATIQKILREESEVIFEGVLVRYAGEWTDLQPGDTYMAERNQGPRLLTVREVKETLGDQNQYAGAVYPTTNAYPYDLWECVKVEVVL